MTKATVSSLLFGSGTFTGSIFFVDINKDNSIFQKLIEENELFLDVKSDENYYEGLVLAQKYRENGIGPGRDGNKQTNPEFLNEEIWEIHAKGKQDDFQNDKEIAKALKQKCSELFKQEYEEELFSKVKKGCKFYLNKKNKELLKFQEEKGDCRFGMIHSSATQKGRYIGEDFNTLSEPGVFSDRLYKNFLSTDNKIKEHVEKVVGKSCKEKQNKLLELSGGSYINGQPIGTVNTSGGNKKHQLYE